MAAGEMELFFVRDVVPGKVPMSVQAVLMRLVGEGEAEEEEAKGWRSWC